MSNNLPDAGVTGDTNLSSILLWFLPTTIIVIFAVFFLDRPVSSFIHAKLYHSKIWVTLTRQLPDTLLIMVGLISIPSYLAYLARRYHNLRDKATFLLYHVACSLPVSFVAKSFLKEIFGRVQTRFWLQHPKQFTFHWFHAGDNFYGFPSGHMAVFATLCAAIWRVYPQQANALRLLLVALGLLLVVTNYHFLSDIIAGAYVGILVEAGMFAVIKRSV